MALERSVGAFLATLCKISSCAFLPGAARDGVLLPASSTLAAAVRLACLSTSNLLPVKNEDVMNVIAVALGLDAVRRVCADGLRQPGPVTVFQCQRAS